MYLLRIYLSVHLILEDFSGTQRHYSLAFTQHACKCLACLKFRFLRIVVLFVVEFRARVASSRATCREIRRFFTSLRSESSKQQKTIILTCFTCIPIFLD